MAIDNPNNGGGEIACTEPTSENKKVQYVKPTTPTVPKRIEMQDLMQWKHLDPSNNSQLNNSLREDPILKGALTYLSYVFKNEVYASASR